jgi:transcriptional regulator with XRE-family HTH domain
MPSNPHAIRVGANVRAEMARRNLSQTALAEQLNVTQQKLSRCISGQQPFRVDELARIAEALDVPLVDLVGEAVA